MRSGPNGRLSGPAGEDGAILSLTDSESEAAHRVAPGCRLIGPAPSSEKGTDWDHCAEVEKIPLDRPDKKGGQAASGQRLKLLVGPLLLFIKGSREEKEEQKEEPAWAVSVEDRRVNCSQLPLI